jgi:hypothetical protein
MALVSVLVGGCSVLGLGDRYPPVSDIRPLPKGAVVIFDVIFPPQGSDNDGDRVVAIGLPDGTTASMGWAEVLCALEPKRWSSGAFRPSLGVCADRGKQDPCPDVMSDQAAQGCTTSKDEGRTSNAELHYGLTAGRAPLCAALGSPRSP